MTIENTLEQMAVGLERMANALERLAVVQEAQADALGTVRDFAASARVTNNSVAPATEPTEPVVATEVVRKRGRPRKDEVKREELQEKPATADAPPAVEPPAAPPEAPAETPAAAEAPTEQAVKDLILSLVGKVGRGPVAAVLAADPFKATRFGTIDPRHHGLLYQRLVELDAADPLSL